jgi:zinc protease
VKEAQLNSLEQDLRASNDEELGKEELQNVIFAGNGYGHTPLGTLAGIKAITLDDVKKFVDENYNASNVVVGLSGDYPETLVQRLTADLGQLGAGPEETTIAQLPAIAARHRDLPRSSDSGDARGRRFRGAQSRAGLARRASRLVRPPL